MEKDDKNLESDNNQATDQNDQAADSQDTSTSTDTSDNNSKQDPLDTMSEDQMRAFAMGKSWNVDESLSGDDLRSKLKERRAIESRHSRKDDNDSGTQDDDNTSTDDVVRRSDLERTRENELRETLEQSDDEVEQDIYENWDKVAEFYVPRNGRETKKDILKDLRIARAAYREANPPEADNSDADAATAGVATKTGRGGSSPKAPQKPKKSIIKKSRSIDDWYKTD